MLFKHEYACILMNLCSLKIHQLFHLKVKIYTTKMKKTKIKSSIYVLTKEYLIISKECN